MLSSKKTVEVKAGSAAVVPCTAAQGAPQSWPREVRIESVCTSTWKTTPVEVIPPGRSCPTSIESSLTGTCHDVSQIGAWVGTSQAPRTASAAAAVSAYILREVVMGAPLPNEGMPEAGIEPARGVSLGGF